MPDLNDNYSFSGDIPQRLPEYWKFEDGTTRTDLRNLTNSELAELGWVGPIEMPPLPGTSYFTHNYVWNSETNSFESIEVDQSEKVFRSKDSYRLFWDYLLTTSVYQKIKQQSSESLSLNILYTEFLSFLNDAKNYNPDPQEFQNSLNSIVTTFSSSQEDYDEFVEGLNRSGLVSLYTLPEFTP